MLPSFSRSPPSNFEFRHRFLVVDGALMLLPGNDFWKPYEPASTTPSAAAAAVAASPSLSETLMSPLVSPHSRACLSSPLRLPRWKSLETKWS
mmetsp:Transcript_52065/g.71471  ORF Transcript_52065/g.71471 Transcript_52065/m.71471 type:complete len:93 (+) Transcript_52065:31-309(+)